MTDKQIIINGVDVSKCKHYDKGFNYCDQSYLGEGGLLKNTKNPRHCEWLPNCYYKQLKRKEQELDKAKKIIETAVDDFYLEYGTPYYDRLLVNAKSLGIEVKDYE